MNLTLADQQLRQALKGEHKFELVVIGGGITGAALFAKAATAGVKVALIEQHDFAWGTSSRSSKMLHGGLRYLASGKVGLVKESAEQKSWFINHLPHLVEELPYLFLHKHKEFPGPKLFHQVLKFYDKVSQGKSHRELSLKQIEALAPGMDISPYEGANLYYDTATDDARLVMAMLKAGVAAGGVCANYLKAEQLITRDDKVIGLNLSDQLSGDKYKMKSCCVANATGVWADNFALPPGLKIRPLRGSHLLLPFWRLPVSAAITVKHPRDGRHVFIYPWQGFSVLGTTDLDHDACLSNEAKITQEEQDYLLELGNSIFPDASLNESDIVSVWSGVRPVLSDGKPRAPSAESREHMIWSEPGLVNVCGGKLTTCLKMADELLLEISKQLGREYRCDSDALSLPDKEPSLAESYELEAVKHLDDLLLRRTRLGLLYPDELSQHLAQVQTLDRETKLWNGSFEREVERYKQIRDAYYAPLTSSPDNQLPG